MDQDFSLRAASARRRVPVRAIVGTALGAFLLGGALTWWIVRSDTTPLGEFVQIGNAETPPAGVAPSPTQSVAATAATTAETAERVDRRVQLVAEQQGGIDQRVAAMEQRLARLDVQAAAAENNAARAEGLLIAFAARRSLERGAQLGYLADQLQLRFGNAQPNAVRTVIAASRDPITLDQLVARLDGLGADLVRAPAEENALDWFSRELGELFVVRRADTPSPQPERRLARARLFLENGRTEDAISEVRNLPRAAAAQDWIADADRYARAQRALELIETAAVLEPRRLRDSAGNPVS